MNKEQIASVIETSPVRLTSDETRLLLRACQSVKPVVMNYNSSNAVSLVELGLMVKVPIETEDQRQKRLVGSWAKLKTACAVKEFDIAASAVEELRRMRREEAPEVGYVLTDVGKQVARGITVRITKR